MLLERNSCDVVQIQRTYHDAQLYAGLRVSRDAANEKQRRGENLQNSKIINNDSRLKQLQLLSSSVSIL